MVLPQAVVTTSAPSSITEGALPEADVALIDSGGVAQKASADSLHVLRARGFDGPIVIVAASPDESALRATMQALGAVSVSRAVIDNDPTELGAAVIRAVDADPAAPSVQLTQARRVFAAGQIALSLQHGINNPLAALLAEAQLLQLEQLTSEQRAAVDRMVELCRRVVALVRRLDALADG
jgi:signal transduction histidine kinase